MTVGELIEKLKEMDQGLMVVVAGYEGGFDDPLVSTTQVDLNDNWDGQKKIRRWDGRHGYSNGEGRQVVVVGR